MENDHESLNHTEWECKYHVVFIPKRRRKALYARYASVSATCSGPWQGAGRAASRRVT
jgi:hypothetical protein